MRGIKTKIGFNIVSLLLISAFVTDVLVIVVVQSVMVRDEIARTSQYLENIGHLFFSDQFEQPSHQFPRQDLATTLILSQDRIQTIHIVDANRQVMYRQHSENHPKDFINQKIEAAAVERETVVAESGYRWSLFWWYPGTVVISVPIQQENQLRGVIAAVISLAPIYQSLSKYHKPILLYIMINTGVLTIVGLYRIFRLYLRPIDRIVLQADEFHEEGDLFFAFRQEDNELNRLSSALNRMLTRISSDTKKLKDTVLSLERANIELKNAQKEIIRAEKMASVGRLAAGIAHEIGNPIGIVLGYLDMLKQNSLDEDDKSDFLRRTEDEVQRINTVIRQLLDLARPKDTKNTHVNVAAVIQDIVDVLQQQPMMGDIQIDLHLEASNNTVWGNDDQLRQVLLNLLLNAADAIQSGKSSTKGRIEMRTSNLDGNYGSKGPMLRVLLIDNGDGIPPETLKNIFDPFYTTKEPGKGTGLGLAVSYMIIDGMGGTIHAESRFGHGATFHIDLPVAAPK